VVASFVMSTMIKGSVPYGITDFFFLYLNCKGAEKSERSGPPQEIADRRSASVSTNKVWTHFNSYRTIRMISHQSVISSIMIKRSKHHSSFQQLLWCNRPAPNPARHRWFVIRIDVDWVALFDDDDVGDNWQSPPIPLADVQWAMAIAIIITAKRSILHSRWLIIIAQKSGEIGVC